MSRRSRPLGVVIIVIFELAAAATLLLSSYGVVPWLGDAGLRQLADRGDAGRAVVTIVAVVGIVAAIGLWSLSRRAWVLTMLLAGIGLLSGLYSWAQGEPGFVRLFLFAIMALYLNQPAVRIAVGYRVGTMTTGA